MTRWFPIAPGTTLPTAPAAVGGQITATQTVPVWNETVLVSARTKTVLLAESFSYSLELFAEPAALTTKTVLDAAKIISVNTPTSTLDLSPQPAGISIGSSVAPSVASFVLAAQEPAVSCGCAINMPIATIDLTAETITEAGGVALRIFPPVLDLVITSVEPQISVGAALAVPESSISLGAFAPVVNPPSPFWNLSWTGSGVDIAASSRYGYRFTVGSSAIVVNSLSMYFASTQAERVIIHRDSDEAVMAQADIAGSLNSWVTAAVSEVTLAANTTYTISFCATNLSGRHLYRSQTGASIDSRISIVANVYRSASDSRPTLGASTNYYAVRFGYQ